MAFALQLLVLTILGSAGMLEARRSERLLSFKTHVLKHEHVATHTADLIHNLMSTLAMDGTKRTGIELYEMYINDGENDDNLKDDDLYDAYIQVLQLIAQMMSYAVTETDGKDLKPKEHDLERSELQILVKEFGHYAELANGLFKDDHNADKVLRACISTEVEKMIVREPATGQDPEPNLPEPKGQLTAFLRAERKALRDDLDRGCNITAHGVSRKIEFFTEADADKSRDRDNEELKDDEYDAPQ